MKNMIRMGVVCMVFMSLAAFAGNHVPSNVAWLKASNSGDPAAWPGAGAWQVDGAANPLDTTEDAEQDYGVKGALIFRPKIGTATFPGKSLTIGALDGSSTGTLLFRTSNNCDTTFDNEGLFLYGGNVQSWNKGVQIVRGKVTVRSSVDAPVKVSFCVRDGELRFRCPVEAVSGAGMYIHSLLNDSISQNQTNFVCRFMDNALSSYNGSIVCSPVYYEGRDTVSWYTKTNYNNVVKPPYFVTFRTDSGTMPGALTLYPNAIVAAESATTDFSVASLSSVSLNGYGTNFLSVALSADGSACSILRVTGTLNLQSPMAVRLSPNSSLDVFAATNSAAAMKLPILKAPVNAALDPAKFFMERDDAFAYLPNYELEVSSDAEDGLSTLWLVRRPVVWSLSQDAVKTSSFTRANWSDGGTATSNPPKDYLVRHYLRTPHTSSATEQFFPGNSLSLVNTQTLSLNSPCVRVDDLRVFDGIIETLNNGDAANDFMAGIINKTWKIDGHIRLASDGNLLLKCYPKKGIKVDAEISGGGKVEIKNYAQSGYSQPYRAFVGLFGMNTNYYGVITVANNQNSTLAERQSSNLAIRDARSLGAPLSKWTYNALTLQNCCGLHPLESLTLDDETRGIYLYSSYYAFFTVTNDVVFTCKERITYSGTLIKDGAGELALGGPRPYFVSDGNASPSSGRNVLDVWEGTLRPVSASAFQGLALVITNSAATLAMDVPASNDDGDIGQYGMLNTTWDAPFIVPENGLVVELRDPNGVLEGRGSHRVPICTVNATARAALDGKISVGVPTSSRCGVKSAGWAENQDGSYTYSVVLGMGLVLLVF